MDYECSTTSSSELWVLITQWKIVLYYYHYWVVAGILLSTQLLNTDIIPFAKSTSVTRIGIINFDSLSQSKYNNLVDI